MDDEKNKNIFECIKCKKIFTHSFNLSRHLKRKYPCVDNTTKIVNIQNKDNEDSIFFCCDFCDKKYSKKYRLIRHLKACVKKKIFDAVSENNKKIMIKEQKNINIVKYVKKKIPPNLKIKVWNIHIGEEIGKSKCTCCNLIDIYQASFSCGHIISEFNGGENKVENLMPICNSCNSSMGIKDMNEYKKEFFKDSNI